MNIMDMMRQNYWRYSCGIITLESVEAAVVSDPKVGDKIEAVMMAGKIVRDDKGYIHSVNIPPAVALAIVRALASDNPQATMFGFHHQPT